MMLNSSFPFHLANKYDILLYSFLQRTHDDELFETLVIVWTFLKKNSIEITRCEMDQHFNFEANYNFSNANKTCIL